MASFTIKVTEDEGEVEIFFSKEGCMPSIEEAIEQKRAISLILASLLWTLKKEFGLDIAHEHALQTPGEG